VLSCRMPVRMAPGRRCQVLCRGSPQTKVPPREKNALNTGPREPTGEDGESGIRVRERRVLMLLPHRGEIAFEVPEVGERGA
jgi:hypothetical protein